MKRLTARARVLDDLRAIGERTRVIYPKKNAVQIQLKIDRRSLQKMLFFCY